MKFNDCCIWPWWKKTQNVQINLNWLNIINNFIFILIKIDLYCILIISLFFLLVIHCCMYLLLRQEQNYIIITTHELWINLTCTNLKKYNYNNNKTKNILQCKHWVNIITSVQFLFTTHSTCLLHIIMHFVFDDLII